MSHSFIYICKQLLPDYWVESDFVDLNELVGALGITPNGIDELSFNSTVQQVVAQYAKEDNAGTSEHPGTPSL